MKGEAVLKKILDFHESRGWLGKWDKEWEKLSSDIKSLDFTETSYLIKGLRKESKLRKLPYKSPNSPVHACLGLASSELVLKFKQKIQQIEVAQGLTTEAYQKVEQIVNSLSRIELISLVSVCSINTSEPALIDYTLTCASTKLAGSK